jgi:hypothetical protein
MKKVLAVLALVFLLACASGCMLFETELTIWNNSGNTIENVRWNGYEFGTIPNDESQSRTVAFGKDHIYLSIDGTEYSTEEEVIVIPVIPQEFRITDLTLVRSLRAAGDASSLRIKDIIENTVESDIE